MKICNFYFPCNKFFELFPPHLDENLLAYFIFRHYPKTLSGVDEADIIRFSVCSVLLLSLLMKKHEGERKDIKLYYLSDYARMFSSEVEYSEENTYKLFGIL